MRGMAIAAALLLAASPAAARTITAATVGTSSTQALAAAVGPRTFLSIDNESTAAAVACSFGGTAALNTAGDYTVPAGTTRTWTANFSWRPLSGAALNCIASGASTPVTIESDP